MTFGMTLREPSNSISAKSLQPLAFREVLAGRAFIPN